MTLADMLTTPGVYAVSAAPLAAFTYTLVEVEPNGTVHQLTRDFERDGILPADDWTDDPLVIYPVRHPKEPLQ